MRVPKVVICAAVLAVPAVVLPISAQAAKPTPTSSGSLVHITKTIEFPAQTVANSNFVYEWEQPVNGVVASQWDDTSEPDDANYGGQAVCVGDESTSWHSNDGALTCRAFWSYPVAGTVTLHLVIDPRAETDQVDPTVTFTPATPPLPTPMPSLPGATLPGPTRSR